MRVIGFLSVLIVLAGSAGAQDARAVLRDARGDSIGSATLVQTPLYGVLLRVEARLPEGVHAIHIHERGACEPPFESAGGHLNPFARLHGVLNSGGAHAGDLPNISARAGGVARAELLARGVVLEDSPNGLLEGDGAAIVVHENADDHTSQPAGDAGARIACGVVERAP